MSNQTHPELSIHYLPALELVTAADSAGPRAVKRQLSGAQNGVNPGRGILEAVVSPFELSDLDFLFAPVSTVIFLFYMVIRDGCHEPGALIARLEGMKEEEFLERFKSFLHIAEHISDWIDIDTIEEALVKDRARENVPFRKEAAQLLRLLASGDTFRSKLVEVLTWFNELIFSSREEPARRTAEAWIMRNQSLIEADPKRKLDQLARDSYDPVLSAAEGIRLFPVTDSANSDIWILLPDEAYIVFSIPYADSRMNDGAAVSGETRLTDAAIEALSDPKRISILRLLRGRPHFGREIADELGISPSTASYHIEKLVTARLARLQLSNGRRFYYTINSEGFRDFLSCLEAEFIDRRDSPAGASEHRG
jgi:DNA-binding transcriptional ArsR family regulator